MKRTRPSWPLPGLAAAIVLAVLGPAGAPPAAAASFPCSKAATADEIAICANPSLNDADVEMATRYSMLLQLLAMGAAGDQRDAQRAWLAKRGKCGGNVACLSAAYASRISALKSAFNAIASNGPY